MSAEKTKIHGIIAEFDGPEELLHAAEKVRDREFVHFDCHSPFPVHGMDEAMGEKRSPLGWIVGIMGLFGGGGALLLQWWTSAVDYPLVISGKPYFSLPAFIPVTFELTILLAAFGAVFGMFALGKIPQLFHPVFFSDRFKKVTDDGFFVSIEAKDPQFDPEGNREFLESIGATYTEVLTEQVEEKPVKESGH
ncbi:MAG: DUF3341 domain-containing protein [Candidatus Marinimicrobia bacterium]|nr:DUF3341 domain-containing protein [Candidatus Neomarinimicrobiota bacterium]MCF7829933.1 DUF3341 domain-containing protein [Candidatus Neomarinimicrobiota bacterium]MCF7879104.1 DUF3341 domain-containing protein [Candidatus Neomarinimicrobiota bacterium]